jgi:hypothetical protein
MTRFAFLSAISAIALLPAGCASRGAPLASAPTATLAPPAPATTPAPQVVELRHFYLLSPGPSSKLVVTRSDIAAVDR